MNRLLAAGAAGMAALCLNATVVLQAAAQSQAPNQKIVADVVTVDGAELRVRTATGQQMALQLATNTRFSGRAPATLASITTGAFVGTTAVPQADGTLLASEVHVFPESMRGSGEGHRPMDNMPAGSTMTNATVTAIANQRAASGGSTMTNATVAAVGGDNQTRRMTLVYQGGQKVVVIPPGIPIVMVEPADRSFLVPGTHVIAYASTQPDGTMHADRVTIGVNGYAPPI